MSQLDLFQDDLDRLEDLKEVRKLLETIDSRLKKIEEDIATIKKPVPSIFPNIPQVGPGTTDPWTVPTTPRNPWGPYGPRNPFDVVLYKDASAGLPDDVKLPYATSQGGLKPLLEFGKVTLTRGRDVCDSGFEQHRDLCSYQDEANKS